MNTIKRSVHKDHRQLLRNKLLEVKVDRTLGDFKQKCLHIFPNSEWRTAVDKIKFHGDFLEQSVREKS